MTAPFSTDVHAGLSRAPKSLPSKYFYDKRGDELFMQIMNLPEYYLTRAELEIFTEQSTRLIETFGVQENQPFELIELGAGDGTKTLNLLRALQEKNFSFNYLPVDISRNVLQHLQATLNAELADLSMLPKQGDYFEVLDQISGRPDPKIVLFLGSNMGNLSDDQAAGFIHRLGACLRPGDKLLLGLDLIKPAEIVLPAYNDAKGITRAFNLNLLHRINNELDANFDLNNFDHHPEYREDEGIARSFLVSTADQQVHIQAVGQTYEFSAGEKMQTEISRKYNDEIVGEILQDTDFEMVDILTDSRQYFADYILEMQ